MPETRKVNIQLRVPASDTDAMQEVATLLLEEAKERVQRRTKDAKLRTIERKKFKDRRAAFFALAPEAYRLYQQHREHHQSAKSVYSLIAYQLQLDAPIAAEVLVQKHRRQIRLDRQTIALRLARKGLSNTAIGKKLGVSVRTVSRLLKPLLPSNSGGANA